MTIRRTLILLCLLLLPLSASAQPGARTYVIKKGDTLWGISERFLKDPLYWPNLWANNPELPNPHFIYPGQKLAIYDGRIEVVPVQPAEATVTEPEAAPPAEAPLPEPSPAITVSTLGGARGFVGEDGLDGDGVLIDTVDNRLLMAEGDQVFVRLKDPEAAAGRMFSLYSHGPEIEHPVTGEKIGYLVNELGSVQIVEASPKVATAVVTDSFREIQRGARLGPYHPPVREIELKKASAALEGYVIAGDEGKIALSQFDVVFVDIGAEEGLAVGNLLYISRQRTATELAYGAEELQLPEVLLGSGIVLETRPHTAAALVLKSAQSMHRGDRVTAVTE